MHPTRASPTQSSPGFTLVEVMMATVVTLVVLVGLVAAVTMGSEMLDVSRKQTVAMQILRNEIEHVHLMQWTTVLALPASASITVNGAGTALSAGSPADRQAFALTNYTAWVGDDNLALMSVAKDFTCTLTVAPVPSRANLLRLDYTVAWTGGNRRKTYIRTSSTYYGKNGLNLYYQR